jgi:hypothetical protein
LIGVSIYVEHGLHFTSVNQSGKMLKGTVKGRFSIVGEGTGWKLAHSQMITDAVTADPFSGTGGIGTIAILQISFFFTFHIISSGFV